jgi:hypothetical protein
MRFSRRGYFFVVVAALALLGVASSPTHADTPGDALVVESYVGPRPAAAERLVGAFRAELEKRGYVVDPTVLKMRLERSVARPGLVDEGLTIATLAKKLESGINAWWGAQEEVALANLEPAVSLALRNPSHVARVEMLRDLLFQGYLILSMVQRRQGETGKSEATMGEFIRSFPDRSVEQSDFGPEALELYRFVYGDLAALKKGTLAVQVSQPGTVVYVNEIAQSSAGGNVTLSRLLPGSYRVLVRSLDISDRVRLYNVPVYPDQVTTVGIDWALDSVLVMEKWVGFQFTTGTQLVQERDLAAKLGIAGKAATVVTVSLSRARSGSRLVTRRYDVLTGNTVQVCQADLLGPDRRTLGLLADCVSGSENRTKVKTGQEPATSDTPPFFLGSLRVEPIAAPIAVAQAPKEPVPAPRKPRGLAKWMLGGAGVAAAAAGSVLLYLDGRAPCDGPLDDCPKLYDTDTLGYVLLGAGAASLGASTYLFLNESSAPPAPPSVARASGRGWVGGVGWQW